MDRTTENYQALKQNELLLQIFSLFHIDSHWNAEGLWASISENEE